MKNASVAIGAAFVAAVTSGLIVFVVMWFTYRPSCESPNAQVQSRTNETKTVTEYHPENVRSYLEQAQAQLSTSGCHNASGHEDNSQYFMRIAEEINNSKRPFKVTYSPMSSGEKCPVSDKQFEKIMLVQRLNEIYVEGRFGRNNSEQLDWEEREKIRDPSLPKHFDSRTKWPYCKLLQLPAMNQGACGSCWAVSRMSAFQDRICIQSRGKEQPELSVFDAMTGAKTTCFTSIREADIYNYIGDKGVVTGGAYGSHKGCQPYPFPPWCGSPCPMNTWTVFTDANRTESCRPGYDVPYAQDRYFADEVGKFAKKDINTVKQQLMKGGPVVGSVYAVDVPFFMYRSGIYDGYAKEEEACYGHDVKIVGWGEEGGVEYWIISNSFGMEWGDKGFGKIAVDVVQGYEKDDMVYEILIPRKRAAV